VEGSFINKSLLTLGTVINRLAAASAKGSGGLKDSVSAAQQQQQHIPFRDSKLTRLLQGSLAGGGARIAVVCNITPAAAQSEETANTLKFATRAKLVNVAVSAQATVDERALLRQYRQEVRELKAQVASLELQQKQREATTASTTAAATGGERGAADGEGNGGGGCTQEEKRLRELVAQLVSQLDEERSARLKAEQVWHAECV
jgi:hypothetical protein